MLRSDRRQTNAKQCTCSHVATMHTAGNHHRRIHIDFVTRAVCALRLRSTFFQAVVTSPSSRNTCSYEFSLNTPVVQQNVVTTSRCSATSFLEKLMHISRRHLPHNHLLPCSLPLLCIPAVASAPFVYAESKFRSLAAEYAARACADRLLCHWLRAL